MKFHLENIGNIKTADIELGDLTIISGKNNTGKTYIAYTIYGFLSMLKNDDFHYVFPFSIKETPNKFELSIIMEDVKKHIHIFEEKASQLFISNLANIFNTKIDNFEKSNFSVDLSSILVFNYNNFLLVNLKEKEESSQVKILLQTLDNKFAVFNIPNTFLFTAERTGTHLFLNEIDQHNATILDRIRVGENINVRENLANYSLPIRDNLNFARNISKYRKQDSFIFKNHSEIANEIEELLGVKYQFVDDSIKIIANGNVVDLHMTSTSVRALLDLYIYIRHLALPNDVIIIDEPELNLHPENQVKLTKVFAKLINLGIKIIITTHSDYITKEVNNLIALSNDFDSKENLMKEYDYKENEIIKPSQVKAYIAKEQTLEEITIDNFGLAKTSFDDVINQINEVSEEIAFGING